MRWLATFWGLGIVKNRKINNVTVHRLLPVDFVEKVDFSEPGAFRPNLLFVWASW